MVFTGSIEMCSHTLTQHSISSETKKPDNKSNICSRTFLERFQTKFNFTLLLLPALCHCASTVLTKLLYSVINFISNSFYHIMGFLSTKNKPNFPIFCKVLTSCTRVNTKATSVPGKTPDSMSFRNRSCFLYSSLLFLSYQSACSHCSSCKAYEALHRLPLTDGQRRVFSSR